MKLYHKITFWVSFVCLNIFLADWILSGGGDVPAFYTGTFFGISTFTGLLVFVAKGK